MHPLKKSLDFYGMGMYLCNEWVYDLNERPKIVSDDIGDLSLDKEEPIENLITWVFDEGELYACAKITEEDVYSIVCDYIGKPCLSLQ